MVNGRDLQMIRQRMVKSLNGKGGNGDWRNRPNRDSTFQGQNHNGKVVMVIGEADPIVIQLSRVKDLNGKEAMVIEEADQS